jgi:hypothetical protein
MLHVLGFIYFGAALGAAFAIIAGTLLANRERIGQVLGLKPAAFLPPLAVPASRHGARARVIRSASRVPALRLAA